MTWLPLNAMLNMTRQKNVFDILWIMQMHNFQSPFPTIRRRALWLLSVPVLLAIVAFAVAVVQISQETNPAAMAGAWKAASMASFIYLIYAFLYAPSYIVGWAWFFFSSRSHVSDIKQHLVLMPVVSACFAWFPVMLVSTLSLNDRLLAFAVLVPVILVAGWLWSFIVYQVATRSLRSRPGLHGVANA